MKRILTLFILCAVIVTSLVACSGNSDVPSGMQLVEGGDDIGYYFYAPKEWTVDNRANISSVHVSSIDTTSVTVTELDDVDGNLTEYLINDIKALPYDTEPTFEISGEECLWGGKTALKFVYTYKHKEVKFKAMQLLTRHGGSLYILTYQSLDTPINEDKSYYSYYLEKVTGIIDNFKFVDKSGKQDTTPEDLDGDGYYLASDKKLSGFELYLPVDYKLEFANGMVSARVGGENGESAKANVSLTQATSTGVRIIDYLKTRKDQLDGLFENFTDIAIEVKTKADTSLNELYTTFPDAEISRNSELKFGGLASAVAYEYTYEYQGTVYHVYQVMGVNTANGYVFTYTATEDCYYDYIDEIKDILGKVVF